MPLTKIQSLGITDGTIVNADINASAAIAGTKLTGVNDAKAWVNFNGTGTPAIRASFNVSSLTDVGTGKYEVNFTNALTDANYSVVVGTNAGQSYIFADSTGTSSLIRIATADSSGSVVDTSFVCVSVFR
jgi:hypothetical protein